MRILFFGTSEFAVPTLEALIASRHEVISVVTQPDKPTGRGLQVSTSPVKRTALDHNIPVLQPRRVRSTEFLEVAESLNPDVLVLASFGQIIPQRLLDLPKVGPINLHGSLLPKYRGAAPIQYSILNGETVTGNTTMWMDATLDTGDVLLQQIIEIGPDETSDNLIPRMAKDGADLLLETLGKLERGNCPRISQVHSEATFAPPITAEDSKIDWSKSASQIANQVRAFSPRPGTFATLHGKRIKLWNVELLSGLANPGEIVEVNKTGVVVGTSNGLLMLVEVQQEGSKRMPASDWARGVRLIPGTVFEAPN